MGSHQKCWLWGRHAVLETLRAGRWQILELHLDDSLPREETAAAYDLMQRWPEHRFVRCSAERLATLCHSREHQGYVAKMTPYPYDDVADVLEKASKHPLFAVLDGIQDPHNFGAVIRSAYVLGVEAIFVPKQGQVPVTALVARSSAGAVNYLRIAQTDDLLAFVTRLRSRGVRMIGTSQHAKQTVDQCDLRSAVAILIGNEGTGIRPELLSECDELITIPQVGHLDSLNAAVSAGILFYEAQRQRANR